MKNIMSLIVWVGFTLLLNKDTILWLEIPVLMQDAQVYLKKKNTKLHNQILETSSRAT